MLDKYENRTRFLSYTWTWLRMWWTHLPFVPTKIWTTTVLTTPHNISNILTRKKARLGPPPSFHSLQCGLELWSPTASLQVSTPLNTRWETTLHLAVCMAVFFNDNLWFIQCSELNIHIKWRVGWGGELTVQYFERLTLVSQSLILVVNNNCFRISRCALWLNPVEMG